MTVILFLIPLSEKLLRLAAASDPDILLSASAVQLFIFAVPAAFYCKIKNAEFPRFAKIKRPRLSEIPFVIASAFTYFFTAIIILYIEFNLFSLPAEEALSSAVTASSPFGTALAYVIIPAVAEELFFRSVILSDYAEFKGPVAICISALFFAMLHFSFAQFPLYFLLGAILATITYTTNSSFPSMTIHLINNTLVIFGGSSIGSFLKETSSSPLSMIIVVACFMGAFIWMLSSMETLYERRGELYETGDLPGSRRDMIENMSDADRLGTKEKKIKPEAKSVFLSPTFFICILTFILISFDII